MITAKELTRGVQQIGKRDPVIARLADLHGEPRFPGTRGRFESLVRSILSQQISGAAARTIIGRLESLAGGLSSPDLLLPLSDEEIRSCGISGQKGRYLRSLLEHVGDGRIDLEGFDRLDDQEVIARLTDVTGIGTWTAKMFLMFSLGRPDVLPWEDLGVRNGMRIAYELPEHPSRKEVERIAEQKGWSPFRSIATWYMWRATEVIE